MLRKIRNLTSKQWTIIGLVIFVIILILLLPLSVPLIAALFTAILLNPIVRLLQYKGKFGRTLSVVIVFLILLFLIGFVSTFIVTKAIAQVVNFVEDIPMHTQQLNNLYDKWEREIQQYAQSLPDEFLEQVSESIQQNLASLGDAIREKITIDNIAQMFSKVPNFLVSFLVYLIALFLFMLELPAIKTNLYKMMKKETAEKVTFMGRKLNSVFLGFIKAQLVLSFIIFVVALIGLLIISPDVALIMSLVIWIVDLIPIIGSIIILGPWALYMFLAGKTAMGIKLSILAIVLLAIRRIVEPKVMGQQIGLSPLLTLISMFLGLKIIGFLGLIIGPLIVILITSAFEADIIKWKIKI
ncbi:MAG TPA: sporulation integral membrane protein YtvI [Bacillota bacterium]|nr:sporulation integral membrane protein YtvI [Bacillota bacterium]